MHFLKSTSMCVLANLMVQLCLGGTTITGQTSSHAGTNLEATCSDTNYLHCVMSIEMIIPSRPSILSLITHWITFPSPTPRMRSQVLWALEILSMAAWRELSNWRMSRRRYCGEQGEKKLTSYVKWLTRPSIFNSPWMVFQILTLCQRNHLGKSPQSLRWPSSVMRCLEINGSG